MGILTESMLRAARLDSKTAQYHVAPGTYVTESARVYLKVRGIQLVTGTERSGMPCTPIEKRGNQTFQDAATGAGYAEKPERMTHLRGNLLVPKTHPQIALRGKLDTLQGEIILTQTEANAEGLSGLIRDLGELLELARELLGAEVSGRPLSPLKLLGYDECELRTVSHNVKEHFGISHPTPCYEMGRSAARLHLLRAQVRETELAAEHTFADGSRCDILLALNRMSSAVYIMLCRLLSGKYGGKK